MKLQINQCKVVDKNIIQNQINFQTSLFDSHTYYEKVKDHSYVCMFVFLF